MLPASPVVRHGPCASATAKPDEKSASAFARHCESTALPLRVVFPWQPSFVFTFLPVALSLTLAQRFSDAVGRSAVTNAPTFESIRSLMPVASPVVMQPPHDSAFVKLLASWSVALARHVASTVAPRRAALAWHASLSPALLPAAFILAPQHTCAGVPVARAAAERSSTWDATTA